MVDKTAEKGVQTGHFIDRKIKQTKRNSSVKEKIH